MKYSTTLFETKATVIGVYRKRASSHERLSTLVLYHRKRKSDLRFCYFGLTNTNGFWRRGIANPGFRAAMVSVRILSPTSFIVLKIAGTSSPLTLLPHSLFVHVNAPSAPRKNHSAPFFTAIRTLLIPP